MSDDAAVLGREPEPAEIIIDDNALSACSELDRVMMWLLEALLIDGPKPARQIQQDCQRAGFSLETLRRAKQTFASI